MSFFQWQGDDLLLICHIQPRAKETSIAGTHNDKLKIRVSAPPIDNKANQQITSFLAIEFDIKKSNITLVSGQQHREKKFLIKSPKNIPKWFQHLSKNN